MRECMGRAEPGTVLDIREEDGVLMADPTEGGVALYTDRGPRKVNTYDMPLGEIGQARGKTYIAEARERGSMWDSLTDEQQNKVLARQQSYLADQRVFERQLADQQIGGDSDAERSTDNDPSMDNAVRVLEGD